MLEINSITDGLSVKFDKQIIMEYHFQPEGYRTYWHPLRLSDSPVLTMNTPSDHIHHQGMWVAWKKINGVNFWEQPASGDEAEGFGRIVHQRFVSKSANSDKADFTVENAWIDWRDLQHLKEIRQTTVRVLQENYWIIDIALRFIPSQPEVTLDLKRGEPGKGGLFYSGLTIRFDNAMTPGKLLDADGRSEPMEIFGKKSRWCGFAGEHSEDGQVYGITIIDHFKNPRHPTPWWVRNSKNYALLQPSFCYNEPFHLSEGEELLLRYRVVVHRGHVNPELLKQLTYSK